MTDNEMNSIKTDIALIQKDVKQIERVFQKVDNAVERMAEIHKALAVQENILENNEKRISVIEDKLIRYNKDDIEFRKELSNKLEVMRASDSLDREKRHKELLESIEKMNRGVSEKLDKQDKRISTLENWRWYMVGIGFVIIFIINKIPWTSLFG